MPLLISLLQLFAMKFSEIIVIIWSQMMLMLVTRLIFSVPKFFTKKPDSILCMEKVGHYDDVVSINVVEFIDKQRHDNDTMKLSIKMFGKDDNNIKLLKQLTTIVPHDCNCNMFAIHLFEKVAKEGNTFFVYYLNPEKNSYVEDIS